MARVCTGCLSGDRKLRPILEFTVIQMYTTIIYGCHDHSDNNVDVALCWECNAIIVKFLKFKKQVQASYNTLQTCASKSDFINLVSQSTLNTHTVFQFTVPPNSKTKEAETETLQVIKSETHWPATNNDITVDIIKSEDDSSVCSYEEVTLAEIKQEKIKKKNKLKKRVNVKKRGKEKNCESKCYKEIVLSVKEIENERLLQSSKEEYKNSLYKCEKCILPFPNADDLKDHTDSKHDPSAKHKCNVCECTFSHEVSFNYHRSRHVKRYDCNKCKDRFATPRRAERHYETHVYVASYKCDECRDEFGTQEEFEIHNIEMHKSSEVIKAVEPSQDSEKTSAQQTDYHPCTVCSKTFKWKTSLRKHMETHSIEAGVKRRPYCETCSLSFTTTSSLQKHMKTSSKHQVLLKISKLPDGATEAANIKPAPGAHRCALCGHSYQWRGNLRRHMETHRMRANGSLACVPCNRTFSSQATFQQHLKLSRSHIAEEDFQYVCAECGARFATRTRLRDHTDWEHLKRYTHVCDLCQKVFKSHTSLYLHKQVVHKKDAVEHLCDHCGKGYPTLTKLRAHVSALHAGRAHSCAACPARFSWPSCLARHVRTMHKAQQ